MEWLTPRVVQAVRLIVRVALPPVLVAVLGALVDVGLLDGALYQAVERGLSVL